MVCIILNKSSPSRDIRDNWEVIQDNLKYENIIKKICTIINRLFITFSLDVYYLRIRLIKSY